MVQRLSKRVINLVRIWYNIESDKLAIVAWWFRVIMIGTTAIRVVNRWIRLALLSVGRRFESYLTRWGWQTSLFPLYCLQLNIHYDLDLNQIIPSVVRVWTGLWYFLWRCLLWNPERGGTPSAGSLVKSTSHSSLGITQRLIWLKLVSPISFLKLIVRQNVQPRTLLMSTSMVRWTTVKFVSGCIVDGSHL